MSETPGSGRARGRARGRPAGSGSPGSEGEAGEGSPGNGDGNGSGANRGRGGYRPLLSTIPRNVKETVGTTGTNVSLMANYLRLETPGDQDTVHSYRVDFAPDVESSIVRKGMLGDQRAVFNNSYTFDGMFDVKSTTRLPEDETVVNATRKSDNAAIQIKIKYVGQVDWGSQEMLRLYNTQIRRNLMHLKYIMIGRHFYDPTKAKRLDQFKIALWPGLQTAVNIHDGGVLMVCETTHKVVRSETVYDVLKSFTSSDKDAFQDNARKELNGAIVLTGYNNKTYRIDDIDFDHNPQMEFERKGTKTTLVAYYKQQYNITIRDEKQPLISVQPSARDKRAGDNKILLLIPELCSMTGLSEAARADQNLKRAMTQSTQAVPNAKIPALIDFKSKMEANKDIQEEMGRWKLKFAPGLVSFNGRQLANEKILMARETDQNASTFEQKGADWERSIRGKEMRRGIALDKWAIIVSQKDKGVLDSFGQTLTRVGTPLGFKMSRPNIITVDNDRSATFAEACKSVRDVNMVVVIVPNNSKDRYDSVKKIFCVEQAVASQVIVAKTLMNQKSMMSVCTKIAIQMACKLGAEAWALTIPPKKIMVVGYDTYHDGLRRGASVGGFVCSLNETLTRWYSRVAYHTNNDEMSNKFAENFTFGLKHYYEVNKCLPDRIIVYRDGVSEGQIPHVFNVELDRVKDAIRQVAGETMIRLAFIIVTKRVVSRFFLRTGPQNAENPHPGTIIDHTVTRQGRYDFYLISQSVRHGTVGPVNYNIIEDETAWKPHHHQQLAYKLCHLYFNWMGTIKVPAPCQYAHKLAFLTGTSLHREPSVQLCDTLFYL